MKRLACLILACGIGWYASVYGFSLLFSIGEWISIQRPLLIPSAPSEIKQRPVIEPTKGTLGKV